MPEQSLLEEIRKKLESKSAIGEIREELGKNHSQSEIDAGLRQVFSENKSENEVMLISYIEKMLAKKDHSQALIDIMSRLQKKGYSQSEIEKCIFLANAAPKFPAEKDDWIVYSFEHITAFFLILLMGIYFDPWYFISALILVTMIIVSKFVIGIRYPDVSGPLVMLFTTHLVWADGYGELFACIVLIVFGVLWLRSR